MHYSHKNYLMAPVASPTNKNITVSPTGSYKRIMTKFLFHQKLSHRSCHIYVTSQRDHTDEFPLYCNGERGPSSECAKVTNFTSNSDMHISSSVRH